MRPCYKVLAVALMVMPAVAGAMNLPPLPAGMCALDEKIPAHAEALSFLRSASAGSNTLVTAFASCDELSAIAAQKGTSITRFGSVMMQTLGQKLPIERKAYTQMAAAMYAKKGQSLTETALTDARAAAAEGTAGGGITEPKAITADAQGVLFKNNDMVIIGMKQNNQVNGKTIAVASTAALTLIGGAPASVNLYAPANAPGSFSQSAATLKPYVTQLVAANP